MRLSSAKNSHVCESHTKKPIIGQTRNSALKERNRGPIGVQIDHIEESFVASVLEHQIDGVPSLHLVLFFRTVIELEVLGHEGSGSLRDIISHKLGD